MLRLKIKLLFLFLMCFVFTNAQTNSYKYKREIKNVNAIWHAIQLPDELYKNLNAGFEDLRIFGISGNDTVEVPYLLKQKADKVNTKEIPFKQLNQSARTNGYYYTFQSPAVNTINQIKLTFKQPNFDWKVTLEGSYDNKDWFRVLKDYRILSIINNETDYQFTKLTFPDSKYSYYRIAVKSELQPNLLAAKISKTDTIKGIYNIVNYKAYNLINDTSSKESIITVDLKNPVPLSYLKLNVQSDFDFYRSFRIEYATDSFKTEKGMQFNYAPLHEGTISSLEKAEFKFPNTIASRLKITIKNNDNRPLRLTGLQLQGNVYEIIARFDEPKLAYALYYGNESVTAPNYEIKKFESKIPTNLSEVKTAEEQKNPAYSIISEKPLFENKAWLWILMAVIIALLGWFSFKMLKN